VASPSNVVHPARSASMALPMVTAAVVVTWDGETTMVGSV
jgi:hypothetical protein